MSNFPTGDPSTTWEVSNARYKEDAAFSLTLAKTKLAPHEWAKYLKAKHIDFLRTDSN